MCQRLKAIYQHTAKDASDCLARSGLRTLVVAMKVLTTRQYGEWQHTYN